MSRLEAAKYDMIFLDPPYRMLEAYGAALNLLRERGLLAEDAVVICERARSAQAEYPAEFEIYDTRLYGETASGFSARKADTDGMKALFAGSFSPPTCGHCRTLFAGEAPLFGELVVAVLSQEGKQYALPPEKRAEMLRKITAGMPGVTVVCSTGLLVDLMAQVGADVILRGVRDAGRRAGKRCRWPRPTGCWGAMRR